MSEKGTAHQSRRKVLGLIGAGAGTSVFGSGIVRGMSTSEKSTTTITQISALYDVETPENNNKDIYTKHIDGLRGLTVRPEEDSVYVREFASDEERNSLLENDAVAMTSTNITEFSGKVLNSGIQDQPPIQVDSSGEITTRIRTEASPQHPGVVAKQSSAREAVVMCQGDTYAIPAGTEKTIDFFSEKVPVHALKRVKDDNGDRENRDISPKLNVNGSVVVRHLGDITVHIE